MNQELLKYIKELSKQDKKSLSEKGLKISEETGELSKAILPYSGAYATTHRFVLKEKILEECIDNILCALSIAYDLNYEDNDIEEMLFKKSKKWGNLQLEANKGIYPLPFEIHITVDIPKDKVISNYIDDFKNTCENIKIKSTLLELEDLQGNILTYDLMTSSFHIGDNESVLQELNRISNVLQENNFIILRKKIETVPWHPATPTKLNEYIMGLGNYFETHFELEKNKFNNGEWENPKYQEGQGWKTNTWNFLIDYFNNPDYLAFSVNSKRKDSVIGLTLRSYQGTIEQHQENIKFIKEFIPENSLIDIITEFVIYDDNIEHDNKWIKRD